MTTLFKILALRKSKTFCVLKIIKLIVLFYFLIISTVSLNADFEYKVVKGDTLFSIAIKYKAKVSDLKRINKLKVDNIKVGQILIIPSDSNLGRNITHKVRHSFSSLEPVNKGVIFYTTKEGDTIESISKLVGLSQEEIIAWNDLRSKDLKVGMKLVLTEPDFLKPYFVKKGDSLSKLSQDFDISSKDILKFNFLNDDKLKIGQQLFLKKATKNVNFHYVKRGETLGRIAYIYGVTAQDLVALNGNRAVNLKAGSLLNVLKIVNNDLEKPVGGDLKIEKKINNKFIYHSVAVGETLYSIARHYGVLIEDLKNWNNLNSNNIMHDQKLKIFDKKLTIDSSIIKTKNDLYIKNKVDSSSNSSNKVQTIVNLPSSKNKKINLNTFGIAANQDIFDISSLVILDSKIPIFEVVGDFYYWYRPRKISQPSEFYSEDWHSPLNSYKKATQLFKSFEKLVNSRVNKGSRLKDKLIILDPGHGGLDPGAIVKSRDGLGNEVFVVEDEYVYDIALRLYVCLKEEGANVELTILAPDHLIRNSVFANNTFVNVKNEVYNDYDLNKNDTVDSWISGTPSGLKKRLIVVKNIVNKYKHIKDKDIAFFSLHADNSVGAPKSMGFYYQKDDEKKYDTHSKSAAEKITEGMKRSFYIKGQNLHVLRNNIVMTKLLVEVRNLAFPEEAWSIRSSKLRDQDSKILANGIFKILENN
ncbi:LysM peptidoglycan-binding domain-containing protein [Borreliella americana]|uniref:LysM peptidoglycan-binding domain-containing protein n=1 Tax=Borreliella americana TaxID=478807 RepID=UPI001E477BBD|nr:LysM peptidoglycan-binding domain-containing protein [Borreliella americana]MCD2332372.1 LysM peptidoglycan-binding domain-containing protein [Borreliella americana]MCD2349463.1 LysM peptidoglycan-binding domain-containing protein [Borreliella americana]MCD2382509.1 LysM peptidoglycan-binding domain-containing protein [Borreliella americana]